MSEKTPRQLGEEATKWRATYKDIEDGLEDTQGQISSKIQEIRNFEHENSRFGSRANEQYPKDEEKLYAALGRKVLSLDTQSKVRDEHDELAVEHYRENAAGYHDLGVLEAAMDGVHINVEQPEEAEERVDVKKS